MGSWIKDPYKGIGYVLVKQKDGIMELEQIPCSRSCEIQEIIIYAEQLWEHYSNKYKYIKVYDRDMKLLKVLE